MEILGILRGGTCVMQTANTYGMRESAVCKIKIKYNGKKIRACAISTDCNLVTKLPNE